MTQFKNILVIHPQDPTTEFLSVIYSNINATVLRDTISNSRLRKLLKEADRVIMLGHGTEQGMGDLTKGRYIINSNVVNFLREKKDNIHIWCNADEFVKKYGLKGFTTGMFISEFEEAYIFGVDPNSEKINKSNNDFARIVSQNIHKSGADILKALKIGYNDEDGDMEVIKYNSDRLYNF